MNAAEQLVRIPSTKKKPEDELAPSLSNRPLVNSATNGAIAAANANPKQVTPQTQGVMSGVKAVWDGSGQDIQSAVNQGDYIKAAGATVRGLGAYIPAVIDDVTRGPIKAGVAGLRSFSDGLSGDGTAMQAKATKSPQQQASYSNEGNSYKTGGALQSPAVSTSQPAAPTEVGSNAAIAAANPAGRVTKTVDANGRTTYSGQNVSGDVSFVGRDGKPLAGAPGGTYNEGFMGGGGARQQLAGGIGSTAGGGGGGLPLYNVGGTGYSTRENAIMAANIRDGIDPMTGLNGAPQVSIMGNSGARSKSPGQAYMEQAMNAPRTLTNLTQRQRDRIADTAARMDATAQQGASDAARLNLQGQELAFRQQDAASRLAMDGRRLDMDMARFNAEQPRRDAELVKLGIGNQEAKSLIDARDAYTNAKDGSSEQKSALKRLQTLSGKFSKEGEWDASRVGRVDANGNRVEDLVMWNKGTGEQRIVSAPQTPIHQNPQALAIKNNTSMSNEQKVAALKQLGY